MVPENKNKKLVNFGQFKKKKNWEKFYQFSLRIFSIDNNAPL